MRKPKKRMKWTTWTRRVCNEGGFLAASSKTVFERKYSVTLTRLVNPVRDIGDGVENPETKNYYYEVVAPNESAAIQMAKEQSDFSVWESSAAEN